MVDELLNFYRHIMRRTITHAAGSLDPSTQNAAVLCQDRPGGLPFVLPHTFSVNEFPRGVEVTPERWERPAKYQYVEHAERNSIYLAASFGTKTFGLTLVCPWAACTDCARAIIQAGIRCLVTIRPLRGDTNNRWDDSIRVAMGMLSEANVEVVYLDGPFNAPYVVRRNGQNINL